MKKALKFIFLTLFLGGAAFYLLNLSSVSERSEEDRDALAREWRERISQDNKKLFDARKNVEEHGIEKKFSASVEVKKKPFISVFPWEDIAVLYPLTTFNVDCAFQVFYSENQFVWSDVGVYWSPQQQDKTSPGNMESYVEIYTSPVEAFDLYGKNIQRLDLRIVGLQECVGQISHVKIETHRLK